MKFINYLESITGVGFYPLVSFLIFFLFFLGVTIYVLRTRKSYFDTIAIIPLDTTKTDVDYEKK